LTNRIIQVIVVASCLIGMGMRIIKPDTFKGIHMKRKLLPMFVFSGIILLSAALALAASDIPKKKQTVLGLYLTAKEAFSKWQVDSDKVVVLDVRTPEEYIFVGHAPMARNIPVRLLIQELTAKKRSPVMEPNPDFVSQVKRDYKDGDTILVMCRSGGRSAMAVNLLAEAGFIRVYNITDGFEGDAVTDPASYYNGLRVKNGWKNSGAPWTYSIEPDLMYHP
jgi:rhodanese-related sulfurtransferase